ncbi:hypothetical protein [Pseudonocardia sp. N23]|uniref:hypothetical protein n=1 Tax=Pseudonocardia sp. N23 TaxID=1987376 RepID=UPI000BFD0233|nr:hypothetical protein [Pseudonocardia sp. N23]GAY07922.1 hypothetical protein TOK_5636 [Pseudonocardia sp. N23]
MVRWANEDGLTPAEIADRLNTGGVPVPRWDPQSDRLPDAVEWRIRNLNGDYNLLRSNDFGRWSAEAVGLVLTSPEAQSPDVLAAQDPLIPEGDGPQVRITVDVAPATAADGYQGSRGGLQRADA